MCTFKLVRSPKDKIIIPNTQNTETFHHHIPDSLSKSPLPSPVKTKETASSNRHFASAEACSSETENHLAQR